MVRSREGKKASYAGFPGAADYAKTQNLYHASTLSDSTLYNLPFPRSYVPKYYPSYTYAPNVYLQKEPLK